MEGLAWKTNILLTAFFVPGILFGAFFAANLMLWSKGSSAAVPFGTLIALLSLWLFISTPLTFVGAFFGFKADRIIAPVRTNQIPRQVPEQTLYTKPLPGMLMGGILPFGCIFIQLFFILNSIWLVFENSFRDINFDNHIFQGSPNLLHVRIFVSRLRDPSYHMFRSHSIAGLFPSLCRRL